MLTAHDEAFSAIRPASAFIQIVGSAIPERHVEIEAACFRATDG